MIKNNKKCCGIIERKKFLLFFLIGLIAISAGVYLFKVYKDGGLNFLFKKDTRVISKVDFSIRMPQLWQETTTVNDALAAATIADNVSVIVPGIENLNPDQISEKNSYVEYLTVAKATDKLEGHKISEYGKYVENSLTSLSKESKIIFQSEEKIGKRDAYLMEIDAVGVANTDFKSLTAFVAGNNGDIWIISLSSSSEKWDVYKSAFYESARSFVIKK